MDLDIDLAPYEAIDDAYQETEQDLMLLRMLQGAEGTEVSEEHALLLAEWVGEFQRRRSVMHLVLQGLALPGVADGALGFKIGNAASVEQLVRGAEEGEEWKGEPPSSSEPI